jgi:hypothetical protein
MERLMADLAEGHAWFAEEHKRLLAAQDRLTKTLDRFKADNKKRFEGLN